MGDARDVVRRLTAVQKEALSDGYVTDARCLAAIASALDEARAEERRNVVEWLRTEDACRPGDTYLGWIAGRIERGEHLKAQEKQG